MSRQLKRSREYFERNKTPKFKGVYQMIREANIGYSDISLTVDDIKEWVSRLEKEFTPNGVVYSGSFDNLDPLYLWYDPVTQAVL